MEHEEHFGGPAADALDVAQRLDQRLVVERGPGGRVEAALDEMRGQVAHVARLALGEADLAQRRSAEGARRVAGDSVGNACIGALRASLRATSRRQIASAALTEICWPTIARHSAVNASLRRVMCRPG